MTIEQGGQDPEKQEIGSKIKRYLSNLWSSKHIHHPTKFESILQIFQDNNLEEVDGKELGEKVFPGDKDPERSIQMKIARLNIRLKPFGIEIVRSSNYKIRKADNE